MAARRRAIDRLALREPGMDREALVARILCGDVLFDGVRVRDPREPVRAEAVVTYRDTGFVSRGGLKLDHALSAWHIDVAGKVILDAGASTGGFTDALLRRGAAYVHAVDVGYNQLAYSLRTDPRVAVHERTNVTGLRSLQPLPDMAVADLSFRSLSGVAAHLLSLTRDKRAIVLVKPQFEWRAPRADFNGRVPDEEARRIATDALAALNAEGVDCVAMIESPITGRRGNREFFALITARQDGEDSSGEMPGATN